MSRKKKKQKKAPEAYSCEAAVRAMGQGMTAPYFSFIAHARESCIACYSSLAGTAHIAFEVVFVGPKSPMEGMPDNFRYIQSDAKPAQCLEIAARNAKGEYLIPGWDDMLFSDYFLNKIFVYTMRTKKFEIILGSRIQQTRGGPDPQSFLDASLVFDESIPNSPVIVMTPVFKRELWSSLGGVDSRFESSFAEIDLQMRGRERGMTPFIIPDCSVVKTDSHLPSGEERQLLNSLWVTSDGRVSKSRLSSVSSFE